MTFNFGAGSSGAGGGGKRIPRGPHVVKGSDDRNPLADFEPSGDVEADSQGELDALKSGFRDRAKREADRFKQATDTEYWSCLVFRDRESKEAFLAAVDKSARLGDKYINCHQFAKLLGIELPPK